MTGLDVISQAMQLLVALGIGDTPSAEEASYGRTLLNAMLASWSVEGTLIFSENITSHVWPSAQQTRTIGDGGQLNDTRPVAITSANYIHDATGLRTPVKVISDQEWAAIMEQGVNGLLPEVLYDDFAFPLSTLFLRPIPSSAGHLELFTWQQLSSFPDLVTDVTFPPGYDIAIVYGLAVRMAPGLVGTVNPAVLADAEKYKASIMKLNLPPVPGRAEERIAEVAAQPVQQ